MHVRSLGYFFFFFFFYFFSEIKILMLGF